ncbi:sporulation inhibitor of replication protein SirA [Bacillus atrophaeus]|uniref:sporulation inhibitor of replication protein SirA n=1 Tax=Bacillus atrophaeus TaxID=1452 RepID=UPI00227DD8DC|nr:sporulation inhibitor of replication protein SirA [Bacillus atrophaeus]MCY8988963.1 sporulation inhibitor of replication protein SirA [Bacillus atrophaeus]MCY9198798.1 sporulation inhibitor of replication protein SirA [Bacillus atrophaeus]MEC0767052.1 sporulation inhibitor of replication protein SirA [Bacillus atrophaeus]MEC0779886.1 sporulation inhibitor of replication protein SirA [Bacillus atrophaeus]MEC0808787.1 sporulation inhibitor of replication protein SirA [Bacillus atrophaeus]
MERHYYTYLIKDEFANHYFGRESVMFKLFQDYHWTNLTPQQYQMTEKQIQYITKPIPMLHMHQRLKMNLSNIDYTQLDHIYRLSLPKAKGYATFMMKEQMIEIVASGDYESETIFFEVLRKVSPCFLAMDFGAQRYGWLNPVKERNFV